jgi:tRNA (guanine-N7-)-methyltransferase
MREMLPRIAVAAPDEGELALARLFDKPPAALWLEVGFGKGEHLIAQAAAHPDIGFIGCEPFRNGLAGCLAQIAAQNLGNIRLFPGDARDLLDVLPTASIGRMFLLHPDPWPKARHGKRRFIAPDTLDQIARVLADGAALRLATDDAGYAAWALMHGLAHPAFAWPAEEARDWLARPADWPLTRYGKKALAAGRPISFLSFIRMARRGA